MSVDWLIPKELINEIIAYIIPNIDFYFDITGGKKFGIKIFNENFSVIHEHSIICNNDNFYMYIFINDITKNKDAMLLTDQCKCCNTQSRIIYDNTSQTLISNIAYCKCGNISEQRKIEIKLTPILKKKLLVILNKLL